MQAVVKTFTSPDDQRRIQIFRREDGLFSFREDNRVTDWDGNACWAPIGSARTSSLPIFDSAEAAEREARSRIRWLSDRT
jgi:hypothetical protein